MAFPGATLRHESELITNLFLGLEWHPTRVQDPFRSVRLHFGISVEPLDIFFLRLTYGLIELSPP
jgi:hypothetical protein